MIAELVPEINNVKTFIYKKVTLIYTFTPYYIQHGKLVAPDAKFLQIEIKKNLSQKLRQLLKSPLPMVHE